MLQARTRTPWQRVPLGARRRATARWLSAWKREAADYRVVLETSPETVLSLHAESALDWTNPIRISGGVALLWVADGRPQAFACFFRYKWEGRVQEAHEFHSLATVPLVASLGGRPLWHPAGPGIRLEPIPAPPAGGDGCGTTSPDPRPGA